MFEDISKHFNTVNYKYSVKSAPKQAYYCQPLFILFIKNNLDCENSDVMSEFKNDFPKGVNYYYDINNK
ncbi:hypothetical protein [Gilliamella sp. App4-10]|uniref:hypothetical protein n=1 Tax=Gilliamella sp. App4-10 TaxID=3120231 RepID=UPI00080E47D5|nr:hypothetical protein [Gilliamella apicola]OCG20972.1 hypothetical protein A9G23_05330 [Gilliamella apicola]